MQTQGHRLQNWLQKGSFELGQGQPQQPRSSAGLFLRAITRTATKQLDFSPIKTMQEIPARQLGKEVVGNAQIQQEEANLFI